MPLVQTPGVHPRGITYLLGDDLKNVGESDIPKKFPQFVPLIPGASGNSSPNLSAKINQAVAAHGTWRDILMFLLTQCPWLFDPGAFAGRTTDTCQGQLS